MKLAIHSSFSCLLLSCLFTDAFSLSSSTDFKVFSKATDEASCCKSWMLALCPLGRDALAHHLLQGRWHWHASCHYLVAIGQKGFFSLGNWDSPWKPSNNGSWWIWASQTSTPKHGSPMHMIQQNSLVHIMPHYHIIQPNSTIGDKFLPCRWCHVHLNCGGLHVRSLHKNCCTPIGWTPTSLWGTHCFGHSQNYRAWIFYAHGNISQLSSKMPIPFSQRHKLDLVQHATKIHKVFFFLVRVCAGPMSM
jgi:hypothetical protein